MIDFSKVTAVTIPEGVVTQIAKNGVVLWKLETSKPIILEVEKITSNTYAGETTYNNEEFILLDIYPKTNGTVSVTYGGLTKTITDTSGAEEPNAQQVFFGTFNGVSDSVTTPASGTLTIEGDCDAFGIGVYDQAVKYTNRNCYCITEVTSLGAVTYIPIGAFGSIYGGCTKLKNISIPSSVTNIHVDAFLNCRSLENITVDDGNGYYSSNNGILFNKNKTEICAYPPALGFESYAIPSSVTSIGAYAFYECSDLKNITIPSSVTSIGVNAFLLNGDRDARTITVLSTIPAALESYAFNYPGRNNIVVPKGCGDVYKTAENWSSYADYITEAS